MGLVEIHETLIQTDAVLFEKQAAEFEKQAEEDAAGRIMGRGFLDELEKLAAPASENARRSRGDEARQREQKQRQAAGNNLAMLDQERRKYQAPPVQKATVSSPASPSAPPAIAGQPGHLGMTQSVSSGKTPTRLKMAPEKKRSAIASGGLVDKVMSGARAKAREDAPWGQSKLPSDAPWGQSRLGEANLGSGQKKLLDMTRRVPAKASPSKPVVAKKKSTFNPATARVTLGEAGPNDKERAQQISAASANLTAKQRKGNWASKVPNATAASAPGQTDAQKRWAASATDRAGVSLTGRAAPAARAGGFKPQVLGAGAPVTRLSGMPPSNAPGAGLPAPRMMPQAPSQKAFPPPSPRVAQR